MTTNHKPNRLAKEKSPYLLQHAYNPVTWFPWSDEAFEKAKQENKPVFLSIGYSTCHYCHVMERESFEDDQVAQLLNDHYICIKVDREERPDIDHAYMTVCQALTGQGGWPLTVFLTPEKIPFYAGTYFPKTSKYGRIGMMDLLEQIQEQWQEEADKITENGRRMAEEIEKQVNESSSGSFSMDFVNRAYEQYKETLDKENGGFGTAPKFPSAHQLSFLLRYARTFNDKAALQMVEKTLHAMYRGGIYDHIGYGFARYSTDENWLVPHFEKMLYDNALLAIAYTEAFQFTRHPLYRKIAEEIFTYVLRDMTSLEGVFYSAEDADSEGVEGKFYVWLPGEVEAILGMEDGEWMCDVLDITPEGNFEGASIPNLLSEWSFVQRSNPEQADRLSRCMTKLYDAREKRVKPFKDDKVLTSWNGLMIAALAKAGAAFQNDSYTDAAARAFEWILENMKDEAGNLLARYRDGEAAISAFIDDYAYLAWGALELYEATHDAKYVNAAMELQRDMDERFWDTQAGGYFFSSKDGEQLFMVTKEVYDGALPSGNSIAAYNLVRLAKWTGDLDIRDRVENLFESFANQVTRYPAGHAMFMQAMELWFSVGGEWIIAGSADDPIVQRAVTAFQQAFTPHEVAIVHDPNDSGRKIHKLLPMVADKVPKEIAGEMQPQFYICENFSCQAPFSDIEKWVKRLREST